MIDEPESRALRRYVRGVETITTNEIATVEVQRAVRLSNPSSEALEDARRRLGETWLVELDAELIEEAALLGPPRLRTLDAIHLATALELGPDELVAYDRRLLAAASEAGLTTASPR